MNAYQEHVERISERKPCLSNLRHFLTLPTVNHIPCRIVCLNFAEGAQIPKRVELDLKGLYSTCLSDWGARSNDVGDAPWFDDGSRHKEGRLQGRLILIEDLDKNIINLLGENLDIDPMFFAGHLHISWKSLDTQPPEQCILPSQMKQRKFVNLHYQRTVLFDKTTPPAKKLRRRMNVDRKVAVLSTSKGHVGLVQHCTSLLMQQRKEFWLGVILVDRAIDDEYLFSIERGGTLRPINLPSRLFLGGYEDFHESPSISSLEERKLDYPNRRNCLEDLVFYFSRQQLQAVRQNETGLNALAYYPLKIIAAEWMKYVGLMYQSIKEYEYIASTSNLKEEIEKLNSDLKTLQRWRRRSMSSGHKISAVIRTLKANVSATAHIDIDIPLIEDFEYILATLNEFGHRLESMLPVVTSMVQIIDSRRSLDETANVSRLTVMALVFVPLAYISSLFSMNEKLGPGGPLFWIYFVVAIPVTIVVFLVANPPYSWNRRELRSLKWSRGNDAKTSTLNTREILRKATV